MPTQEILVLTDLLLTALEKLVPRISQMAQKGEITVDQQSELLARMAKIENATAFSDPAWKPEDKA